MNGQNADAVGVIAARFQVPDLHEGHRYTIETVAAKHKDVLIILGRAYAQSDRNPLTFEMRKRMVELTYPNNTFTIVPSDSLPSSRPTRSKKVDEIIMAAFPNRPAIIYGARDSFIDGYCGVFPTERVQTVYPGSATEVRKGVEVVDTSDFRKGVIHTMMNRKAIGYPAVDVAITNSQTRQILLVGKHAEEGKLRFPGVFFDAEQDDSYEAAAVRCVAKELPGVSVLPPQLLGSCRVNDWKFARTKDTIVSLLVRAEYKNGMLILGKGIDEARWVDIDQVRRVLIPAHLPLYEILMQRNK